MHVHYVHKYNTEVEVRKYNTSSCLERSSKILMNLYAVGTGKDRRIHSSSFIFAASYSPCIGPTFASSSPASKKEYSPLPSFIYQKAPSLSNITPPFTSRSDLQDPRHLKFEGEEEEQEEEGDKRKRKGYLEGGELRPCKCKQECLSKFTSRDVQDRRCRLFGLCDSARHEFCFNELLTSCTALRPGVRKIKPT